jgi:uncharacterized protein
MFFSILLMKQTSASSLFGDWEAELVVPGQKIPLAIHLKQTQSGISGTLDSPNQNAFAIKMTQLNIVQNELEFEIEPLNIRYRGKLSSEGNAIQGHFTQHASVELTFKRPQMIIRKHKLKKEQTNIIGAWTGMIELPGSSLPFVLHIDTNEHGLIAQADSPQQKAFGLTIDSIRLKESKLTFDMKHLGASYSGTFNDKQNQIEGRYKQRGASFRLVLSKGERKIEMTKRPQTPVAPFGYHTEDIVVENTLANITLAGTYSKPFDKKVKASIILITGSGPQDRDETVMRHKPFLVIADYLTKHGFGVLRLDDRGVGQSTGQFHTATSEDFASDISAAVDYLKSRPDVNNSPIGLLGHSEGAVIAPMVANERDDLAFLILLAGPGKPIVDFLAERDFLYAKKSGVSEEKLTYIRQLSKTLYQEVAVLSPTQKLPESVVNKINKLFSLFIDQKKVEDAIKQAIALYNSSWFRYFINHDPQQTLRKITIPVLALNGDLDVQVPAKSNLQGIKSALNSASNLDSTIMSFPELNHLFQTSETGFVEEYNAIEETISPIVLKTINDWLNKRNI